MRQPSFRRWLSRPQASGAEPWVARSAYRTRASLAAFGLLVTGVATVFFGVRALDDARPADVAAALLFGVIALVALVNIILIVLRSRGARHDQRGPSS